jgi:hypothetical protein
MCSLVLTQQLSDGVYQGVGITGRAWFTSALGVPYSMPLQGPDRAFVVHLPHDVHPPLLPCCVVHLQEFRHAQDLDQLHHLYSEETLLFGLFSRDKNKPALRDWLLLSLLHFYDPTEEEDANQFLQRAQSASWFQPLYEALRNTKAAHKPLEVSDDPDTHTWERVCRYLHPRLELYEVPWRMLEIDLLMACYTTERPYMWDKMLPYWGCSSDGYQLPDLVGEIEPQPKKKKKRRRNPCPLPKHLFKAYRKHQILQPLSSIEDVIMCETLVYYTLWTQALHLPMVFDRARHRLWTTIFR